MTCYSLIIAETWSNDLYQLWKINLYCTYYVLAMKLEFRLIHAHDGVWVMMLCLKIFVSFWTSCFQNLLLLCHWEILLHHMANLKTVAVFSIISTTPTISVWLDVVKMPSKFGFMFFVHSELLYSICRRGGLIATVSITNCKR